LGEKKTRRRQFFFRNWQKTISRIFHLLLKCGKLSLPGYIHVWSRHDCPRLANPHRNIYPCEMSRLYHLNIVKFY
jgi:hypothetical protein